MDIQGAFPRYLRPLTDSSTAIRKFASKSLVGHLLRQDIPHVRELFRQEIAPEVIKWLAMALARASDRASVPYFRDKRLSMSDANARDWLLASEAVLQPLEALRTATRLLQSGDPAVWHDGAIWAWGTRGFTDELTLLMVNCAAGAQSPDVRRWAALGLYQQHKPVPTSVLIDNVNAKDYLLREWSLHVLSAQPNLDARSTIESIIDSSLTEHPRVVEWAVHTFAAINQQDSDDKLITVYNEVSDQGVREACAAEIAHYLTSAGAEFLADILNCDSDPILTLTVLQSVGPQWRNAPRQLRQSLDAAAARLQESNQLIATPASSFEQAALTFSQRAQLDKLLDNPAMRTAVRLRLGSDENASQEKERMMDAAPLMVGAIIALDEEFDYFSEVLGGNFETELSHATGSSYFVKQLSWPNSRRVTLVTRLVGRKGAEHAAVAATQLVSEYHPSVLVNLGISGVLDADFSIGDVIVADAVISYLANSRIEDDKQAENAFAFRLAGDPFRTDKWLGDRAANLKHEAPSLYEKWQRSVNLMKAHSASLNGNGVQVHRCDIAAGPSVAASDVFKRWLLTHSKRDYCAIDMESGGVATAAWSDAANRVRLLVLRGFSDEADSKKAILERTSGGQLRKLATSTVSLYLLTVLQHIAATWGSS